MMFGFMVVFSFFVFVFLLDDVWFLVVNVIVVVFVMFFR